MKSAGDHQLRPEDILFFVPNLIGYARLCLLILGFCFIQVWPICFLVFYCVSIFLDLIDGWAARKLNQCSAFGAWIDVIVDNISRTCIWTNVYSWGWIIVSIEWVTFVCNHQSGSKWREENVKTRPDVPVVPPGWMLKVMANGFKTPLGTWVILGLHCLPVWIYAMQNGITNIFLSHPTSLVVCLGLIGGRIVCLGCELWCIKKHILELMSEDVNN